MFKVSFHVRHCLIPPFNVTDPTVPFIRLPIGSSPSLCYNERRVYEIGMERVFALERHSKVFCFFSPCVLIRALLSKARSQCLPTFSFISPGLVLRHRVALTQHHRMQPVIVPYVSLSLPFHVAH